MSRLVRVPVILAALAASLVVAAATPAWAHLPDAAPADHLATPPAVSPLDAVAEGSSAGDASAPEPQDRLPLEAVLAFGVSLAAALAVRRRGLIAGLGLLVAVLAVEASVHSVHHVGDAEAAADCVVAVVSAQVNGTLAEPSALDDTYLAIPVGTVQAVATVHPGLRPRNLDTGRAPPTA